MSYAEEDAKFCVGEHDDFVSLQPLRQPEQRRYPELSIRQLAHIYWDYSGADIASLLKTVLVSPQEREYLAQQLPTRGGPESERRSGRSPGERGFPLLTMSTE
jgi:hypothetical protein